MKTIAVITTDHGDKPPIKASSDKALSLINTMFDAQILAVLNYLAAKPPLNRSVFDKPLAYLKSAVGDFLVDWAKNRLTD